MKKLLIAGMAIAACFCGSVMTVHAADQTNEIENVTAVVGKSFSISLHDYGTAGYSWQMVQAPDKKIVSLLSTNFLPPTSKLVGAGGVDVWKFKAKKVGTTTFRFWDAQWWDPTAGITMHTVVVNVVKKNDAVVYSNTKYGFKLTTASNCKNQFKVEETPDQKTGGITLDVYPLLSKEWPSNSVWYSYGVMSETAYNKVVSDAIANVDSLIGKPVYPSLVATLKNNYVIAKYDPQDGPSDLGDCSLNIVNAGGSNFSVTSPVKEVEANQNFTLKVGETARMTTQNSGGTITHLISVKSINAGVAKVDVMNVENNWPVKTFDVTSTTKQITYTELTLSIVKLDTSSVTLNGVISLY